MKIYLFLATLLLLISCSPVEESYEYNGYSFTPVENYWGVTIRTAEGDKNIIFYHHPEELEEFQYEERTTDYFQEVLGNNGNVLIGIGEELSNSGTVALAGVEVSKVTGKALGMNTESGITSEGYGTKVVNCGDADSNTFVLEFRLGEEEGITSEDHCGVITAESQDSLTELSNLFVYKILGIM